MQAFTSSIRFMVYCAMALHKLFIPAASSQTSAALWIAALCVSLSYSTSELRPVIPFLGLRAFHKCWALVPSSYGSIGVQFPPHSGHSSPCICSFDKPLYIAMPREQPRMGSRRGGSRGRATSQRSTPISYSSLDALEPGWSSPPVTRSGRGRGRGQVRMVDCEHASHPTVRYRILCSLANSTFIVSVTIEKCEDARGSGVAHPGVLADQRMVNQIENQRQVMGGTSMVNPVVPAGPSAPARGEPTGSAAHHSDSEDSLQFGCRVIEEPYTSEDE